MSKSMWTLKAPAMLQQPPSDVKHGCKDSQTKNSCTRFAAGGLMRAASVTDENDVR